ncbi:hypothetical protein CEXT_778561, partial [Caerostris extrusa]
ASSEWRLSVLVGCEPFAQAASILYNKSRTVVNMSLLDPFLQITDDEKDFED